MDIGEAVDSLYGAFAENTKNESHQLPYCTRLADLDDGHYCPVGHCVRFGNMSVYWVAVRQTLPRPITSPDEQWPYTKEFLIEHYYNGYPDHDSLENIEYVLVNSVRSMMDIDNPDKQ